MSGSQWPGWPVESGVGRVFLWTKLGREVNFLPYISPISRPTGSKRVNMEGFLGLTLVPGSTWVGSTVPGRFMISDAILCKMLPAYVFLAFIVYLLTSFLRPAMKSMCVIVQVALDQIAENNQGWKESDDLLLACTDQFCVFYLKSSERWVPGPLSPQTSVRPQTNIQQIFLVSPISHSCLFPGSTKRADKIGIMVKLKQGDGLLDKGPGRENQYFIVCAVCWLLEMSCLAFFILLFSSVKIRWQMYYDGFIPWIPRPVQDSVLHGWILVLLWLQHVGLVFPHWENALDGVHKMFWINKKN